MSEPEKFLSRWARLKREASETPVLDEKPDATPAPQVAPGSEPQPSAAEPTLDLSALPSIESITATTDIRAFLAPGVPAELTRAALRRAWVSDPAIRDFIGIAENQWDFNDPNSIPGFGSLSAEDAGRLLAQVFGKDSSQAGASAASPVAATDTEKPANVAQERDLALSPPASPSASELAEPAAQLPPASIVQRSENENPPRDDAAPVTASAPARRGHGGALPT